MESLSLQQLNFWFNNTSSNKNLLFKLITAVNKGMSSYEEKINMGVSWTQATPRSVSLILLLVRYNNAITSEKWTLTEPIQLRLTFAKKRAVQNDTAQLLFDHSESAGCTSVAQSHGQHRNDRTSVGRLHSLSKLSLSRL